MTTRKRTTVTLPADLLSHARAAAGGNLSAYVERALRAQQLRDAAPAVRAWRERAADDTEELAARTEKRLSAGEFLGTVDAEALERIATALRGTLVLA